MDFETGENGLVIGDSFGKQFKNAAFFGSI